jgi:DNA polymerase-1
LKLIREKRPAYLAVAMDGPREQLIRREIDPTYKAQRGTVHDDIIIQVKRIRQILKALGIPTIKIPGYEADDIIATLAVSAVSDDVGVTIVTGDKDLGCLLTDSRIRLFDPYKNEFTTAKEFETRMGFTPAMAIDVMTLTGDTADNIPSIAGWGPKTATKWITKTKSLKRLIGMIDELDVSPKLLQSLKDGVQSGRIELNRQLVTLERNVPIRICSDDLAHTELDLTRARHIFEELGFARWYEDE